MTANLKTWTTTEVGNFVRGTQEATKLSLKKKQDTLIALCSLEQLNLFKKKKKTFPQRELQARMASPVNSEKTRRGNERGFFHQLSHETGEERIFLN